MTLPIIILLERHWDIEPKKALISALPFLTSLGYDTLCFESPSEKDEKDTIAEIETTVKGLESTLTQANACLAARGLSIDLPSMDYDALRQLLKIYVSSGYYNELALHFKELPGHKEKIVLLQHAQEKNIKICGIDLTSDLLKPIRDNSFDFANRFVAIKQLDKIRTLTFKDNIIALQQERKGIIFVVGQSHYVDLIEEFSKEHLRGGIIFLYPHSSKTLDKNYVDNNLSETKHTHGITLVEKTIYNNTDIEIFLTNLKKAIQPMLDNNVFIEPTSTCKTLSNKTKLNFQSYVRPGHFVDSHHFFNNRDEITNTEKKLKEQGIQGFFTFFKNKQSFCIPSINIEKVASQIQKMDL